MTYAHELTYPELLRAKEGVSNAQGVMLGGPDRRFEDEGVRFREWQKAIQSASKTAGVVPKNVMEYFQATKHLNRPPKDGDANISQTGKIDPALIEDAILVEEKIELPEYRQGESMFIRPANFTPPKFAWSYSRLSTFLTCPAKFAAEAYYKTVPYQESEAMKYGNLVHAALEHAVQKKATAYELKLINDIGAAKYVAALESSRDAGADVHVEKELCFNNKFGFSAWWNADVWYRGKADVLVVKDNKLTVWDYKTGAVKPDFLQLRMMCAFAALYFPQAEIFDGKLLFLKHGKIEGLEKPLTRGDLKPILTEVVGQVRRMEVAWAEENWVARKNGLCRQYCGNTACPHCG